MYPKPLVGGLECISLLAPGKRIGRLAMMGESNTWVAEQNRCESLENHEMCLSRLGTREWQGSTNPNQIMELTGVVVSLAIARSDSSTPPIWERNVYPG